MMKKVLSIVLAFAMLLSFANVALAAEPVAERLGDTSIINVTGWVENGGKYITLLLVDENDESDVKHVEEVKISSDGSYRIKFKYAESVDGLVLKVKQDGEEIKNPEVTAIAQSEAVSYTLNVRNVASETSVIADIKNYFNVTGETYALMTAFYDENNKLIYVAVDECDVDFDENNKEQSIEIPENAAKIKAFLWDSTEKMIPLAKEKESAPLDADGINILAIGNSFTDDPTAYLRPLATADGVKINLTFAIHSGSSIWQHWTYHKQGKGFYGSQTVDGSVMIPTAPNNTGEWETTLSDYIDPAKNGNVYYDYVIFQQVSQDSGKLETYGFDEEDTTNTYDNCAENLAKAIRQYQPTAEIVLQQTWAYETGYGRLSLYDGTTQGMHNDIAYAVSTACERLAKVKTEDGEPISLDGKPLRYIPTGDAFMNAKEFPMFDTTFNGSMLTEGTSPNMRYPATVVSLHRDGFHSSSLYGRYLGALVWYGSLTGNSPLSNKYKHVYTENGTQYEPSDRAVEILKNAAQKAIDDYGRWN